MFSKFRSAILGYKVKNISINGVKISTSYKGKRPSSDPLAILKELKVKLNQNATAVPVTLDFSKYWEDRLGYLEGIHPSATSKFQIDNRHYRISRFVTKQNRSPLSIYTFSNNDKIFALFSRVYDYGNYFKEIENDLISNYNLRVSESDMNLYHLTNQKYYALVDVFGHSQSFVWNDKEELDKCLGSFV
ncbi:hypothetical protein [Algoriphagus aquimarinus]|uniref:hypothetical protein n=1 Tax=Algoriphagus aquimarinus TaxID=237018 RepID=UPI0030D7A8F9|tara:strand:+ start:43599 stop:44165 length:567 start_codon:yes stop_codon:yes gene_type:complete